MEKFDAENGGYLSIGGPAADGSEIAGPVRSNASSSSQRSPLFLVMLAGIMLALFCIVGSHLPSLNGGLSNFFEVLRASSMDTSATATTVTEKINSPAEWTLQRDGYEVLPYFLTSTKNDLTYAFLNKYEAIIEPSADMKLYVEDFAEGGDTEYYYSFEICSSDDSTDCQAGILSNSGKSTSVNVDCIVRTSWTISVSKYQTSDDSKVGTSKGTAVCSYVRREIRDLTEADLEKTMDAMYAIWSMTDEDGQSLYGSNFRNITYFVGAHQFNAAWRDGDHIHEGLGFLPQHIKITNMFEESMQAVDKSVHLPFWDYTIDEDETDGAIEKSYVFSEDLFGSIVMGADPAKGWTYGNDSIKAAHIQDGRWKKVKAEINYAYDDLKYNYGYYRAPWNMNPSPYISRYSNSATKMPKCSDHYTFLHYSSFGDMLKNAAYAPHASMHGIVGGVYGCDMLDQMVDKGLLDADSQVSLCNKFQFMMKELYRLDYISPQDSCTADSLSYEGISCSYTCNAAKSSTMANQLSGLIGTKYTGSSLSNSQWEEWKDFICEGDASKIFVGDHVESASPADPSFWPIHPTLERLLHAKMLSGGYDDVNDGSWYWPASYDELDHSESETYVCDKSSCYEDGTNDYYEECCYGHYKDDQLLDFVSHDKSKGYGMTNSAILTATDPTSEDYSVPYIYEKFTWEHCESSNFLSYLLPK